jgi:hypothetical protein
MIPYNQNKLFYINNKYIEQEDHIVGITTLKLKVIRDLAWNIDKKIWVVVGGDSDINQIYYYDSSYSDEWENIPRNFSGSFANKVACNNDYFLISGTGVGTQKIIKWVNNDRDILEIPVPLNKINGLVWNKVQKKWIVFGDNIIYSNDDCSSWQKGNQDIFSSVLDVACNNDIWVAVGQKKNGEDGDVIAYSSNGDYWYPIKENLFERGTQIIWNGNVFIAMGYSIDSKSIIYYSSEGTKWTNLDISMFVSEIHSIATSFIPDQ